MRDKAIIFDLDGTAINSPDKQIPTDRLVTAIKKAQDTYYMCAATGRVWSFAKPVIQALSLTDPCVVSAGTQIYDPIQEVALWQCNIAEEPLKNVVKAIGQYAGFKVLYNDYDEDTYFNGASMPLDEENMPPVYFLGLIFVPNNEAPEIVERLSQIKDITCTLALAQRAGYNDILITNPYATKEHAVAELLKVIAVQAKDTIGVGDGHNDIHLFNAVEKKVAMGNAVQSLKEQADEVCESVENDGLARYIEKLL